MSLRCTLGIHSGPYRDITPLLIGNDGRMIRDFWYVHTPRCRRCHTAIGQTVPRYVERCDPCRGTGIEGDGGDFVGCHHCDGKGSV